MVRFSGSTYSRQPFRPRFEQLRDLGFDYAEIDLAWIRANPDDLRGEEDGLVDLRRHADRLDRERGIDGMRLATCASNRATV